MSGKQARRFRRTLQAASYSEMLLRHHITEVSTLHSHRREISKHYTLVSVYFSFGSFNMLTVVNNHYNIVHFNLINHEHYTYLSFAFSFPYVTECY
jgi:hypothetical protein